MFHAHAVVVARTTAPPRCGGEPRPTGPLNWFFCNGLHYSARSTAVRTQKCCERLHAPLEEVAMRVVSRSRLMLLGALPMWPHSRSWGTYPSGGLGMVVLILVVLVLMGRI